MSATTAYLPMEGFGNPPSPLKVIIGGGSDRKRPHRNPESPSDAGPNKKPRANLIGNNALPTTNSSGKIKQDSATAQAVDFQAKKKAPPSSATGDESSCCLGIDGCKNGYKPIINGEGNIRCGSCGLPVHSPEHGCSLAHTETNGGADYVCLSCCETVPV